MDLDPAILPDPSVTDLCRELRLLDDARRAAREELDEVASLVVAANPLEALPNPLRSRLSVVTGRIDDLEARRDVIREELATRGYRVAPTVPVQVR